MKGFTFFKELNLGPTDTHLIIPLAYRRKKKRYRIKSDLAFWLGIKYQIVCPSGHSQALLPHWIIYRSVCACSNETQQLYKLQPLYCTTDQDPSLKTEQKATHPWSSHWIACVLVWNEVVCVNSNSGCMVCVWVWGKLQFHDCNVWNHTSIMFVLEF